MPNIIKAAILIMALLAVMHLVIPVVMFINTGQLASEVLQANPTFTNQQVATSVQIALRAAVIFHVAFFVATVVLAGALARRKKWSRIMITILGVLSLLFSVVSWRSSSMFHALIVCSNLLLIALLIILWAQPHVKRYLEASDSVDKMRNELERA